MIRIFLFAVALAVGGACAGHGYAAGEEDWWGGEKLSEDDLRRLDKERAKKESALDSENRTGYHSAYHRSPDTLPKLHWGRNFLWSDTFDYKVLLLVARAVRAEGFTCDTISGAWEAGAAGFPAHNYVLKCDSGARMYQLFPQGVTGTDEPVIRAK